MMMMTTIAMTSVASPMLGAQHQSTHQTDRARTTITLMYYYIYTISKRRATRRQNVLNAFVGVLSALK